MVYKRRALTTKEERTEEIGIVAQARHKQEDRKLSKQIALV